MRLLKFLSVFVLTAVVIFGIVLGLNWKAFKTFLDNRDSMLEGIELVEDTGSLSTLVDFIAEHPEYVSVASKVIGSPDSTRFYQTDVPRVMGTSGNIFILLAAAIEIENGTRSAETMISWADISRFQLPAVNESLHSVSYDAAAEKGWIIDEAISTENALQLLAEYNDLAVADYFWWQISADTWQHIRQEAGLEQTELPLPFSGLYQAISTGLQQQPVSEILNQWQQAAPSEWRNYVAERSRAYQQDSEERETIRNYMADHRLGNTFMEERDAMILFPKATAGEMLNLLERLWENDLISTGVSSRVKKWMRWPMESQAGIKNDFTDYGALYDSRMGLLNGLDFGTSAYTGHTTIQAVFFDQLPIAFWFHMSSSHMNQDFQQRLIIDPAMIERMEQVTAQ